MTGATQGGLREALLLPTCPNRSPQEAVRDHLPSSAHSCLVPPSTPFPSTATQAALSLACGLTLAWCCTVLPMVAGTFSHLLASVPSCIPLALICVLFGNSVVPPGPLLWEEAWVLDH